MYLIKIENQEKTEAVILPVEKQDYKILRNENRYFFAWKDEAKLGRTIYKLCLKGQKDILGVISLEAIPSEFRIHVHLLAVSFENKGEDKIFDRIAGCLLAFAGEMAIELYAEYACISLEPKTVLREYYMKKYLMFNAGKSVFADYRPIIGLINLYLSDDKN